MFTPRIVTVTSISIAFTLTSVILKLVLGDAVRALFNKCLHAGDGTGFSDRE